MAPAQNDCIVNFLDLNEIKIAFFSQPGSASWNEDADFDGNDRVDFLDLTLMQSLFFTAPGPSASGCN